MRTTSDAIPAFSLWRPHGPEHTDLRSRAQTPPKASLAATVLVERARPDGYLHALLLMRTRGRRTDPAGVRCWLAWAGGETVVAKMSRPCSRTTPYAPRHRHWPVPGYGRPPAGIGEDSQKRPSGSLARLPLGSVEIPRTAQDGPGPFRSNDRGRRGMMHAPRELGSHNDFEKRLPRTIIRHDVGAIWFSDGPLS
jgi:hypothetical protein